MPLSQPSPDRLIFSSERRSNISSKLDETIYWLSILAFGGVSVYLLYLPGWLLGRFLSHDFTFILAKPLDYTSYLVQVLLWILGSSILVAVVWYLLSSLNLPYLNRNHRLEINLPSKDCGDRGEISFVRMNMFDKMNLFYKQEITKIPLDRVSDIRIAYSGAEPFCTILILLITNLSVKPIVVGDLSCYGSRDKAKKILYSVALEVEQIRKFFNLPNKPSYLLEGYGDLSMVSLPDYRSKQKVLTDTHNVFTFISFLTYFRRKLWNFDVRNNCIILESYFLKFKSRSKIEMNDIKAVSIKRESYGLDVLLFADWILLSPNASKALANLHQDRYSLVLVLKDGSRYKCPNNYLRVFSSRNLMSIEAYADRLRSQLNLPERVNEERCDREPVALI